MSILLAAEEMFAEFGIAAVPLRDIGSAAGQKNNVAVQYHFGDRENLVREIAAYRARASEAMRSELLAGLLASGRAPQVRDVVSAFIASLTCHLEPGNHYLAFLSRYSAERGHYASLDGIVGSAGSTVPTFVAMMRRLMPDLSRAVVEERWMVMMTSAVTTLARYQEASRTGSLPRALPELIEDLVSFFTAALQAPTAG
jgi:AcrR family transcriptional regulator